MWCQFFCWLPLPFTKLFGGLWQQIISSQSPYENAGHLTQLRAVGSDCLQNLKNDEKGLLWSIFMLSILLLLGFSSCFSGFPSSAGRPLAWGCFLPSFHKSLIRTLSDLTRTLFSPRSSDLLKRREKRRLTISPLGDKISFKKGSLAPPDAN